MIHRWLAIAVAIIMPCAAQAVSEPGAAWKTRIESCDPAVVRKAIDDLLADPSSLKEPLTLFLAAMAEHRLGNREQATMWLVAADVRTRRQLLFEQGDRGQLLLVMRGTASSLILPILQGDPEMARRVVSRVQEWDAATPDPHRDRPEAKTGERAEKLMQIDADLARLPLDLAKNRPSEEQAREDAAAQQTAKRMYDKRCGPGMADPVEAEAAIKRINAQAEKLVKVHPLVLGRSGGNVKGASGGAYRMKPESNLPARITISVERGEGKSIFAEVDVDATVTADHKVGDVKLALACVTELWIGQREARWKDVCVDDPKAERPAQGTADLRQYAAIADAKYPEPPKCEPPWPQLPPDTVVMAGGGDAGRKLAFQIDQSGNAATQIDVVVNKPGKAVALVLGAYGPTVWNVTRTPETRIVAALVSGHHRQALAGLGKETPVLVSTWDNKGPCGYFRVEVGKLDALSPVALRMFGRPVDMAYPVKDGKLSMGDALPANAKLIASGDATPDSFHDPNAPLAGPMGIEDALRKGLLRKATPADAEAWVEAVERSTPPRDVPPVAGAVVPKPRRPNEYNAYVVLGPFVYPAGLFGAHSATFYIPKGVQKPQGNPGHSKVYDFNALPPPR